MKYLNSSFSSEPNSKKYRDNFDKVFGNVKEDLLKGKECNCNEDEECSRCRDHKNNKEKNSKG